MTPAEKLRATPADLHGGGRVCGTCGTEWEKKVDDLFEMGMEPGLKGYGMPYLYQLMVEDGYPYGMHAIRRHLSFHKPDLWRRWSERNKNTG